VFRWTFTNSNPSLRSLQYEQLAQKQLQKEKDIHVQYEPAGLPGQQHCDKYHNRTVRAI
jgi:hypothetical protein